MALLGVIYLLVSGYASGPAFNGRNRTGAKGSLNSCGVSAGCHGIGTATTVSIHVDSSGVPVTQYFPGHSYTISIHGTNSAANPKFGFQFASVCNVGGSETHAGTPGGFPTNVRLISLDSLDIVEHSLPLIAATPGIYDVAFTWTAPAGNVGDITLYATLNAVNGNNAADINDISANTTCILTAPWPAAVPTMAESRPSCFPNPATDHFFISLGGITEQKCEVNVFDLSGRLVINQISNSLLINVITRQLLPGTYTVTLERSGYGYTTSLIKL